MKITQEIRSQAISQVRSEKEGSKSFQNIVQSQSYKVKQQEIRELMNQIEEQGNKLARFRSFPDLVKFKRLIKDFLEKTVNEGFSLRKSHHFDFGGQSQQLAIVEEIDEKLVELTEEIIGQEKKAVDLLGMIGEIKGLMVNLYT